MKYRPDDPYYPGTRIVISLGKIHTAADRKKPKELENNNISK